MRIGLGYDVHKLVAGRRLVLGGVQIPFDKGLLGHSDADVVVHSLCDALLGAAGLGDIGEHFPDHDSAYKDISSMILLEKTDNMIQKKGYKIINADTTVVAEKPKILPYRDQMKQAVCRVLNLDMDSFNIKATTTEGLGVIGQGEGIGAVTIVLLGRPLAATE